MRRVHRPSVAWALLAAPLLALACDPADTGGELDVEPEFRVAVGNVENTDIVLGALVDGDSLAIYQCGGDETFETHTGWFNGEIDEDEAFSMTLHGMELSGTRDEDGLSGELVDAEGNRHAFRVDAVEDDATDGIYVVEDAGVSVGVVVQEQGGALTAQGSGCDERRACAQVIILAPLTVEDDAIDVQIDFEGVRDLTVTRTLAAP
ncbi:MAG: hypothetical protein AAF799_46050 [Myxococcota bacterium]